MKNKTQQLQEFPLLVRIIKILIILIIVIFSFLIIVNNKAALSNFSFGGSKGSNSVNKNIPEELKWQEQFNGVDNINGSGSGKGNKKNMNFLQYEADK